MILRTMMRVVPALCLVLGFNVGSAHAEANLTGYWSGTNTASQVPGKTANVTFFLRQQRDGTVIGGYVASTGVYGTGTGKFSGNTGTMSWINTSPYCVGEYSNTYTIAADGSLSWTYNGKDCLGDETGSGTAKPVVQ
ncbi:hypothetical protein [Azospirillum rugosum]|uniref:Avidin family protein n=1 Tax=Azospirillum rugosum TaxID=416170 RepID=A0ABS4SYN0_9PROT|nr:hypothetical protein [Azospirillum rugosum]MBP2297218.1 hypothetical protein [Azospirillum rugosum]MDQ0531060.1 hypothetical protein [Azospirillum rugosum]